MIYTYFNILFSFTAETYPSNILIISVNIIDTPDNINVLGSLLNITSLLDEKVYQNIQTRHLTY